MSTTDDSSIPMLPPDSPGSSVSSRLQDEYEELLKYAVIVPTFDPKSQTLKIVDAKDSFPAKPDASTPIPPMDEDSNTATENGDKEEGVHIHIERRQIEETKKKSVQKVSKEKSDNMEEIVKLCQRYGQDQSETRDDLDIEKESYHSEDQKETRGIDCDLKKMENVLDECTFDLKRNVLAELSQAKVRIQQDCEKNMRIERERYHAEIQQLCREMESLRELLKTYEVSIERKDAVISNLTRAMERQREKYKTLQAFCEWKIKHNDRKRENFAENMAQKHYQRSLQDKALRNWRTIIETKWKDRVEKACQSKATDVCVSLKNDYETKIDSLNEALEAARQEVQRLHVEREKYEETMKKAFMRGVCALNLEAMTMFHEGDQPDGSVPAGPAQPPPQPHSHTAPPADDEPRTYSHEAIYTSQPAPAQAPRVVGLSGVQTGKQARPCVARMVGPSRTLSAKVTGKGEPRSTRAPVGGSSQPVGLAPPMSSVIVERHQPVVKQTIGHATAAKFPVVTGNQSTGPQHRKLAGQVGMKMINSNVQTIKMVE